MAKNQAPVKEKAGKTQKISKKRNKKEIIIIVAIALIIALIDAALVALVVKYYDDHSVEQNNNTANNKYHDYTKGKNTKTEGAYYDTSKTGAGLEVDMEKVKAEIGAYKYDNFVLSATPTDFVVIRVQDYGDIVVALREDVAPLTVNNFKALVLKDFYDGLTIHRVVKNLLIQGGSKTTSGEDKTTSPIYGEFHHNGYENELGHIKGVISMARGTSNDTATSQFMIMHGDKTSFDGSFAAFGYVLSGLDVLDSIASCQVNVSSTTAEKSVPVNQIVIKDIFFVEPVEGADIASNQKAPLN